MKELQRLSSIHRIILQQREKLWIMAGRKRLGQVLTNLISHAIEYSPYGGDITILTHKKEVIISVQDEGIGIPDEIKLKVFDRFTGFCGSTFPGMELRPAHNCRYYPHA